MSVKTVFNKAAFALKKNSPAIFTGLGVIGLGVTAFYAYKSRDKVEAVVENIEQHRAANLEVNKLEVAKDIAEAVYKPVIAGAISVTCIIMAHKIQNNRIKVLVGTLAVEQARNIYFENKYRKQHGDEEYKQFMATDRMETTELDKKGKEILSVHQVKSEVDKSIGVWFEDSRHYVSDDHSYNIATIDSVDSRMQTMLFQRGHIILNEVLEELGFDRIRNGALLGWSTGDGFNIDKDVIVVDEMDENGVLTGRKVEKVYVTWNRPRFVYGEVDLNGGRYTI